MFLRPVRNHNRVCMYSLERRSCSHGSGGRAERAERAAVARKVCDMFDEEHLFGERTTRVYVQRVSTITIACLPFHALARQTDRGGERARRPGASGFQALHSQHSSHRSLAPAGVLVVE